MSYAFRISPFTAGEHHTALTYNLLVIMVRTVQLYRVHFIKMLVLYFKYLYLFSDMVAHGKTAM